MSFFLLRSFGTSNKIKNFYNSCVLFIHSIINRISPILHFYQSILINISFAKLSSYRFTSKTKLTWVSIKFSILPKIRLILTEFYSKWSHCHDFDYYSLLPTKIIKWMRLSHMYSKHVCTHYKLFNLKTLKLYFYDNFLFE